MTARTLRARRAEAVAILTNPSARASAHALAWAFLKKWGTR